ncbi:MAG: hypothetical protein WDM96_03670 [Lacunisphaera sp.]
MRGGAERTTQNAANAATTMNRKTTAEAIAGLNPKVSIKAATIAERFAGFAFSIMQR